MGSGSSGHFPAAGDVLLDGDDLDLLCSGLTVAELLGPQRVGEAEMRTGELGRTPRK